MFLLMLALCFLWISLALLKKSPDDYFIECLSAGPSTYALKTFNTLKDICKAKGFNYSYMNSKILNFDLSEISSYTKLSLVSLLTLILSLMTEVLKKQRNLSFEYCPPAKKPLLLLQTNQIRMNKNKF